MRKKSSGKNASKQIISILLMLALMLFGLAACGGQKGDSAAWGWNSHKTHQ